MTPTAHGPGHGHCLSPTALPHTAPVGDSPRLSRSCAEPGTGDVLSRGESWSCALAVPCSKHGVGGRPLGECPRVAASAAARGHGPDTHTSRRSRAVWGPRPQRAISGTGVARQWPRPCTAWLHKQSPAQHTVIFLCLLDNLLSAHAEQDAAPKSQGSAGSRDGSSRDRGQGLDCRARAVGQRQQHRGV